MEVDAPPVQSEEDKLNDEKKKRAKQIVTQVYNQLTKGCGREFCTNKD
jgi:hypothetical protein